jgi:predicted HTH domain antitoxin
MKERIMGLSLTIEYPEKLPDALQTTRQDFEREAKMAMAVKLYELKRLSSGMAACLVGLDRVSFLLSLHRYGTPMIDLDEGELASDAKNA